MSAASNFLQYYFQWMDNRQGACMKGAFEIRLRKIEWSLGKPRLYIIRPREMETDTYNRNIDSLLKYNPTIFSSLYFLTVFDSLNAYPSPKASSHTR